MFSHTHAITRGVASSMLDALVLHAPPDPIDLQLAHGEHQAYAELLHQRVPHCQELPADDACPDCCFIEDTAVILGAGALAQAASGRRPDDAPEAVAIVTRPGAASRQPETAPVRAALEALGFRPPPEERQQGAARLLHELAAPASLDGGDVLFTGHCLWVGLSTRSNAEAVRQLQRWLEGLCPVVGVPLPGQGDTVLHLKSMVTALSEDTLLVADTPEGRRLMDVVRDLPGAFGPPGRAVEPKVVWVPDQLSANVVRVGRRVLFQAGRHPESEAAIRGACEERGLEPVRVSMAEFAKADGALTCCSLLFSLSTSVQQGEAS